MCRYIGRYGNNKKWVCSICDIMAHKRQYLCTNWMKEIHARSMELSIKTGWKFCRFERPTDTQKKSIYLISYSIWWKKTSNIKEEITADHTQTSSDVAGTDFFNCFYFTNYSRGNRTLTKRRVWVKKKREKIHREERNKTQDEKWRSTFKWFIIHR